MNREDILVEIIKELSLQGVTLFEIGSTKDHITIKVDYSNLDISTWGVEKMIVRLGGNHKWTYCHNNSENYFNMLIDLRG